MTKKELAAIIVTGAVVVVVIVLGVSGKLGKTSSPAPQGEIPGGATSSPASGPSGAYSPEIPSNAIPTKPVEEIPVIDPGTGEQTGRVGAFAVVATKNGFNPETITVKLGDVVRLELTAQGGTYDMYSPYLGFRLSAQDGETKQLSFKASLTGTFSFECRDHCPASGKISGQLIVLPN